MYWAAVKGIGQSQYRSRRRFQPTKSIILVENYQALSRNRPMLNRSGEQRTTATKSSTPFILNGEKQPKSLFVMIRDTMRIPKARSPKRPIRDRGAKVERFYPNAAGKPRLPFPQEDTHIIMKWKHTTITAIAPFYPVRQRVQAVNPR